MRTASSPQIETRATTTAQSSIGPQAAQSPLLHNQTVATTQSPTDFASAIRPFTPDALANGFSTLVGALIGAMLAYALQRRYQRSLERKADVTAGHRLMFSLLQQINTILLIQRDYVFAEQKNPARFLSIPAIPHFATSKNTLELPELAFLLNDSEGRAILYEFYIAQENYVEALSQWNLRSTLHYEKVQPALAASGLQSGALVAKEDIEAALGIQLFGSIVNSTDNCIESMHRSFQKLIAINGKVRPYLVKRFGTTDFTQFDCPETYGLDREL
jgi:hypothetical protein